MALSYDEIISALESFISGQQSTFYYKLAQDQRLVLQEQNLFIANLVNNVGQILDQQNAVILQIVGKLLANQQSLGQQIGTPQQSGQPVTFPTSLSTDQQNAIGAAVWNYTLVDYDGPSTAGEAMTGAGNLADALSAGQVLLPVGDNPLFSLTGTWHLNAYPTLVIPEVSIDSIEATDTDAAAWLNRVATYYAPWSLTGGGYANAYTGSDSFYIVCNLSPGQFKYWQTWATTGKFPPAIGAAAPIWPGLANVTLGTSTPLAAGVTIAGPLDGVIIAISTVPSGTSYFTFDGDLSYRHIGALAFQNDNGNDELPQLFGFQSAILLPLTMEHAQACKIRASGGVVGTATPFTVNT